MSILKKLRRIKTNHITHKHTYKRVYKKHNPKYRKREKLPHDDFLRKAHTQIQNAFAYNLKFNKKVDPRAAYGIFSVVVEALLAPQQGAVSQMARRRVRWLTPSN